MLARRWSDTHMMVSASTFGAVTRPTLWAAAQTVVLIRARGSVLSYFAISRSATSATERQRTRTGSGVAGSIST